MNFSPARAILMQALAQSMQGDSYPDEESNRVIKSKPNPWDSVQLTKAERKGKTYEQMQELRKEKWTIAQNQYV